MAKLRILEYKGLEIFHSKKGSTLKRTVSSTLNVLYFLSAITLPVTSAYALEKFYFDRISYEEYIYSKSKKTEVGDNVELDVSIGYDYSENTKFSFGFETLPEENRFNNKTSKFELVSTHTNETFSISFDAELQSDEKSSGGTSLGVDIDSDKSFLKYFINKSSSLTFYPFNFDGEVGDEFNTWDVTRINYIEGTPTTITGTTSNGEKIANKTIPGLEFSFYPSDSFKVSYGFGKSTYLYPANDTFDIVNNNTVTRWERKEATAHKVHVYYKLQDLLSTKIKYVTQNNTKQTGSLIESAASLELKANVSSALFLDAEVVYTKAGKYPWDVNRSTAWFSEKSPFYPVYADNSGDLQDWINKSDFAYSLKLVLKDEKVSPYVFYRHQGEYFIFRERESAHVLRTADDSSSHGGLHRIGLGSYFKKDKFLINPEFEYLKAKNPVFSSSSDVRDDRILSTFHKTDYLFYLKVSYDIDVFDLFKL